MLISFPQYSHVPIYVLTVTNEEMIPTFFESHYQIVSCSSFNSQYYICFTMPLTMTMAYVKV